MSVGKAAAVVLGTVGDANTLLGAGLTILAMYRQARDAWKAAHPDQDSPFKEDHELIAMLAADSQALVDEAAALLKKHGADEA